MLSFLLSVPVALCLGFLAGLGVGGGSLLLLWLTQAAGIDQPQARIINLLFYLPAALICTFTRPTQDAPDKKVILPGILCGCLSAFLFSYLGQYLETGFLKKLLGGLLILTGAKEIFYRPQKAK